MFTEDLQGDIYNCSPGVSILFLFSHSLEPTQKTSPSLWGAQARPFRGCDIGLVLLLKQRGLKEVEGHFCERIRKSDRLLAALLNEKWRWGKKRRDFIRTVNM